MIWVNVAFKKIANGFFFCEMKVSGSFNHGGHVSVIKTWRDFFSKLLLKWALLTNIRRFKVTVSGFFLKSFKKIFQTRLKWRSAIYKSSIRIFWFKTSGTLHKGSVGSFTWLKIVYLQFFSFSCVTLEIVQYFSTTRHNF